MTLVCSVILLIGLFAIHHSKKAPEAIDVYRGKTELQVSKKLVNDSIVSTDSIVIWSK